MGRGSLVGLEEWTLAWGDGGRTDAGGRCETPRVRRGGVGITTVSTEDFPYRITQMPGDGNALGRVKFMFPNKDNVYLHDTSQPELFAKYPRAFSSGCIRIEQPAKLAEYVLRDRGTWNKETISAAMNRASEQIASLPQSMPIHLVYLTAFGLSDGGVGFRDDVYGYDRAYLPVLCGKKGE